MIDEKPLEATKKFGEQKLALEQTAQQNQTNLFPYSFGPYISSRVGLVAIRHWSNMHDVAAAVKLVATMRNFSSNNQQMQEKEAKTSTNSEFLGSNSENRWKEETEASYSVASRILGCLRLKAVLQRIPGIFTIFFLYLCFFGPIYTPIIYAFYFTWYVVSLVSNSCIPLLSYHLNGI
jgi:hypothetical protein